jgi:hypothetical protein
LLFPEGFSYDKKNQRVLTARVNSFFELIRSFSSELTKQESGDSINFDQISARVTPNINYSNLQKDLQALLDKQFLLPIKKQFKE